MSDLFYLKQRTTCRHTLYYRDHQKELIHNFEKKLPKAELLQRLLGYQLLYIPS